MRRKPRVPSFLRNRAGNIAPMFAMLLVPMVAMMGLAGEGSSWFFTQRAAQYTADQAALAAAYNNCAPGASCATNGTTYVQEAAAVARGYNFITGSNNTTVVADTTGTPSPPCGANTCYRVTITRNQPLFMVKIVGYNGNATTSSGQAANGIVARAVARRDRSNTEFCITTLSNSSQSFRVNGGPGLDLTSCTVFAPNGGAVCNGGAGTQVLGAYVGDTGKTNSDCGIEHPNPPQLLDPYAAKASNIPSVASACPGGTSGTTLVSGGTRSYSIGGPICGNAKLMGPLIINADSVLLIENGSLNLNGNSITTSNGASLTIIFGGPSAGFVTGSGTLDYSAPGPNSGTWSGIAMYQVPTAASNSPTYAGSGQTFDITGLIYAPKADLTISGAINHATAGLACITFFVNSVLVNGGAWIFATPTIDCPRAGLDPTQVASIPKVVMVQ